MLEGGGDALTRSKSEPQSVARPPPLFLSLSHLEARTCTRVSFERGGGGTRHKNYIASKAKPRSN